MTEYKKTLIIPRADALLINHWLEETGQGDQTYRQTIKFDNGVEADIKCCGCQNEPSFTEMVLFSKNGFEICCSDASFEYLGEWTLEHDGVIYTVTVEKEM